MVWCMFRQLQNRRYSRCKKFLRATSGHFTLFDAAKPLGDNPSTLDDMALRHEPVLRDERRAATTILRDAKRG
jgi:hypothetical protein